MRRAFITLLVIFFGFLTALGWYAYDRGFTKKWRNYLVSQFRKEGIEISVHRLTLDPFRGLVGEEVKLYDAKDRRRVLAVIDEVMLGVNYANAVRGRTFLDWIDLRDARLSLPLDPSQPDGESISISHLNARLFLPPKQIYLSRAEAEVYGVRILAAGHLINPQEFHFTRDTRISPGEVMSRVAEELKGLRYEGNHPLLSISFSGDLARPGELYAEIHLHAEDVRRRKYQFSRIDAVAGFRGGVAELQQLDATDARGSLHACGTYDISSRQVAARVQSTLDFQELNRAFRFTSEFSDFFFFDPPSVEFTLHGTIGSDSRIMAFGHLGLGKFTCKSEIFTGLSADASWTGDQWSVRDLQLGHWTGNLTGDAMLLPGDFRARVSGALSPKAFLPLLSGSGAEWLSQFEFTDPPSIDVTVTGKGSSLEECTLTGGVRFGRTNYHGTQAEGHSTVTYSDHLLTLSPFPNERSDHGLVFDFLRNEVRPEKVGGGRE